MTPYAYAILYTALIFTLGVRYGRRSLPARTWIDHRISMNARNKEKRCQAR